jgi:hypothetical protein
VAGRAHFGEQKQRAQKGRFAETGQLGSRIEVGHILTKSASLRPGRYAFCTCGDCCADANDALLAVGRGLDAQAALVLYLERRAKGSLDAGNAVVILLLLVIVGIGLGGAW